MGEDSDHHDRRKQFFCFVHDERVILSTSFQFFTSVRRILARPGSTLSLGDWYGSVSRVSSSALRGSTGANGWFLQKWMNHFEQMSKANQRNGFVVAYDGTKIKSDGLGCVYYYEEKMLESREKWVKWKSYRCDKVEVSLNRLTKVVQIYPGYYKSIWHSCR